MVSFCVSELTLDPFDSLMMVKFCVSAVFQGAESL